MSYYSDDPCMCRVDFFKPSGKWYDSVAVSFEGLYDTPLIHDAFREALERAKLMRRGFRAVCLEPYHQHSHPIMLTIPEENTDERP